MKHFAYKIIVDVEAYGRDQQEALRAVNVLARQFMDSSNMGSAGAKPTDHVIAKCAPFDGYEKADEELPPQFFMNARERD